MPRAFSHHRFSGRLVITLDQPLDLAFHYIRPRQLSQLVDCRQTGSWISFVELLLNLYYTH
jgi:hypothetical protein